MTVEELQVLITANTDSLRSEIKSTQNQLGMLQRTAGKASNGIFNAFSALKTAIVGLAIGKLISANIDDAVSRLDTLNNFPRVMSNLGISNDDAQASINRLQNALTGLPTTLDSASQSVQRLTSANGNIKASTEMFLAMNNAILAGGAPMEQQKSAMEQLSQAYAKGKPDMMEWRSMLSVMPAQLNQLATAMGYASSNQLGEALREGKVSMNDFMLKMIELNQHGINGFLSFEEQARNSTGGVATSIANVKTAFTRGLADIMNAIGQSNIAGFFQGIARAISNVIPYVVAFIKVIGTAVNFVAGLFGKKIGSATKSTTSLKTSLGGVGSAANNASSGLNKTGNSSGKTAKNLNKASNSAKKLKKELKGLASFDEMNVLADKKTDTDTSKNPSSGSPSGGAGGNVGGVGGLGDLGAIDFGGLDNSMSSLNDKVNELYKNMMDKLKAFTKDMNFKPLVDSLKNLAGALGLLGGNLKNQLKDFIMNYLKPVTTWAVNDALPRFFNATAEAIRNINYDKISKSLNKLWKALTPFTISIGEGLLFLYDHVFLPLSTVAINNLLPGALDLISGAITLFTAVLNDVKVPVEWFLSNVLVPLAQWTGSVVGDVLSKIGDALAWIAGNEVALALLEGLGVALGVVAIASNATAIAMAIYNGVATVCTVVTGALGVAINILTSPITLVVAAIALLVAGIILLIKHWDDVKVVAAQVWDKVKEIWGKVCDWFKQNVIEPLKKAWDTTKQFFIDLWTNTVNSIKSIFTKVVNIAQDIWNGIKNAFSSVGSWFTSTWNNMINAVKNIFEKLKTIASNIWNGIKNVFSTVTSWFTTTWNNMVSNVTSIFNKIKTLASSIWTSVKNTFASVNTWFRDKFNSAYTAIKNVFNPIVNFFGGLWDKIKSKFTALGTKIGDAVGGAFKSAINGALRTIENILNAPINAINSLLSVINKVPGVNLSRLSKFSLPRLARGGIVSRPTLAQIGERGQEAVVPLENNTGWIDKLADKLNENLSNSDNPIQLIVKIGDDKIADKVLNSINRKSFEAGREVFNI